MGGVSAVQGGQQAWQPVCSVTHSHSTGQSASLPRPLQPLPFIASQRRKTRISQVRLSVGCLAERRATVS